jgi:pimeloyl-ACP methyl ester carboxylesterase
MQSMSCEVSGTGAIALICIHGWGCEGGQFAALARALDSNFRVYRPDLPGHGATPLGSFTPSFDTYAGWIADFIESRGIENPILFGHSMGGMLSLLAAARLGVRAVINLDGGLPATDHALAAHAVIRGWLDEPDFRVRLAGAFREAFFLPSERDGRCEDIVRTMCGAPDAVLRFLPREVGTLDPIRILSRVTAPVLYVGAANPRFNLVKASRLLTQLRYEQITESGHFLHIYALPHVVSLVGDFLRTADII